MKSTTGAKWRLLPPATEAYQHASALPPLIAQLLYNRGVPAGEIDSFLAADRRVEGTPFALPGMAPAVERIYKALLSGEKIVVYGDFDVDGITATIVMVEGLSWLGGKAVPYIPDRIREGHGLNLAAIRELHSQGVELIITVDCGVANIAEVKEARELGMDMVITDHHLPLGELPPVVAVVDAKLKDSRYPFTELAGVGVAFKLQQTLFYQDSRKERLDGLLDLVALGTVADMAPLVGENRYLVSAGLKVLNNTRRPGLKELSRSASLKEGGIDAEQILWVLGPRINAAGRMGGASVSYRLLTTPSPEEARALAEELEERNSERQKLTDEVLNKVKERIASKAGLPMIIEGDEAYPVGVLGIAAGRLVEEFYKPAIIINLGDDLCRGSCRSIAEFNIVLALEECRELLVGFGGHPRAAGFTVKRQNLAQLEERLMSRGESQLSKLALKPELTIDADISLSALDGETLPLIQKLAPFGQGNPQPTFLSRGVEVVECRKIGGKGEYLKLKLAQDKAVWEAVDFNRRVPAEGIPPSIDVVYRLGKSYRGGEEVLCLNLVDFVAGQAH